MANSFSLDVSRWCEKAKQSADLAVRKIALDVFSRVILRSPVDTGRFRANWNVAIGNAPSGTTVELDPTGTQALARVSAAVANFEAGQTIYLANNLPYAMRLETGWSRQAPQGMVGITVAEFQAIAGRAAQETKSGGPPGGPGS